MATAGSCFAHDIARAPQNRGLHHHVAETAPDGMDESEARDHNHGTYSARYGNLYTARQLVQLVERAHSSRDRSFEVDLRRVSPKGVEHVMRVFFRHDVDGNAAANTTRDSVGPPFHGEAVAMGRVVCDERAIEL